MPNSLAPPQQRAGKKCQQIAKRGKNAGGPCGQPVMAGKETCRHHDAGAKAAVRIKRKCKGTLKTGEPCGKPALAGQEVCGTHGGNSPQARKRAAERIAEEKARKMLARLGVAPVANALEELQRVAGEVVAWKDVCAAVLDTLKTTNFRYASTMRMEQVRSEVVLFERALDRAVMTLSALARLGLDERLVAIEEGKAEMIATALSAALGDGGVTGEAATAVRTGFARRLRVIPGEAA